jgi:hypothetical protein
MYVAFVSHASGSLGFAGRLHALCGARGIVSSCPLWDWEMNKAIIAGALVVVAGTSAQAQSMDFRNSTNLPRVYSPNSEYLDNLNRINSILIACRTDSRR